MNNKHTAIVGLCLLVSLGYMLVDAYMEQRVYWFGFGVFTMLGTGYLIIKTPPTLK